VCETDELNLTLNPKLSKTGETFVISYSVDINKSKELMYNTTNLSLYWTFLDLEKGYFSLSNKTWFHKETDIPQNGSIQGTFNINPWAYKLYGFLSCNYSLCNNTYCCPCNFDEVLILNSETEVITVIDRIYEKLDSEIRIDIIDYPKTVYKGEKFQIKVNITNIKIDDDFFIYSYVYEGLNVLSEDWVHNKQRVELQSGSSAFIILDDKVVNLETPGTYNLKVRVKVDDENYDSIVPINVLFSNKIEPSKEDVKNQGIITPTKQETTKSPITGGAVFETNPKTLYLLLALFSFVLLVVLIKVIK
jgi:hypothetical protein